MIAEERIVQIEERLAARLAILGEQREASTSHAQQELMERLQALEGAVQQVNFL